MGDNTAGFDNEIDLVEYLDNKKVKELNSNLKRFIHFLFSDVNDESIVHASFGKSGQKPDMKIKINGNTKNVSIKIGTGNSVHQEKIDVFVEFLSSLKIADNIIEELLRFHWGDGTADDTGTYRMSGPDYKKMFEDKIDRINIEFNKEDYLRKFINRFIIQGKSSDYDIVDALYYGNVYDGHWASRNEIIEYVLNNSFEVDSVHFGPLTYQTWNRCLNFNKKYESRRQVMQIKWGSLLRDLINIERNRKNE